MRDKKILRTLALTVALSLAAAIGANYSRAVIIEGFTESGTFRSVLVSPDGRMLIAASTGVAQAVFFTSSQPVTASQGTTPWIVSQNSPVVLDQASVISTAATLTVTNFTVNAVAVEVLSIDLTRKSSLVCNDSTLSAFFDFTVAVTTPTGKFLPPGACFSPDSPISYVGPLFINTTTSVKIGVIEITQ